MNGSPLFRTTKCCQKLSIFSTYLFFQKNNGNNFTDMNTTGTQRLSVKSYKNAHPVLSKFDFPKITSSTNFFLHLCSQFQKLANVNPTGRLDLETVFSMNKPRCANEDKLPGKHVEYSKFFEAPVEAQNDSLWRFKLGPTGNNYPIIQTPLTPPSPTLCPLPSKKTHFGPPRAKISTSEELFFKTAQLYLSKTRF